MNEANASTIAVTEETADRLFRAARSINNWTDAPVSDAQLHELYGLMKWGPTSANSFPLRICFAKSPEAREKLAVCASERNADKVRKAPVTAILAYDQRFYEHLPTLFPPNPGMATFFASNPEVAELNAIRNASIQGGYFMIAARMLGLDVGPMSGFDNAAVDQAFFPGGRFKSNFICSIGHGENVDQWPRLPRPAFDEACTIT